METSMTVAEAFELYRLEYIVFRNQSSKTEEMNRLAMRSLIAFTGDIPVGDLTFDVVRKWKDHISKTKGQNTVRGYVLKLRVVLGYLRLKGYTNVLNPEIVGVPKRKSVVVEFISEKEVDRLIDSVFVPVAGYNKINRYRNRAIIALLYASGIRVSELCSLNRLSIREDGTFTVTGKGDATRLCFTDKRAELFIAAYLALRDDNDPALFVSDITGTRITSGVVQLIFRNASKKGGFDRMVHPHTLRHSFATNLLRNNTNLMYVTKFLGHKSVQTTEMYTHVVNEDLRAIYTDKHTY